MAEITDSYAGPGRGPFSCPEWLAAVAGQREREILASRDCECFHHRNHRDKVDYVNDEAVTYYSPSKGSFTVDKRKIVG